MTNQAILAATVCSALLLGCGYPEEDEEGDGLEAISDELASPGLILTAPDDIALGGRDARIRIYYRGTCSGCDLFDPVGLHGATYYYGGGNLPGKTWGWTTIGEMPWSPGYFDFTIPGNLPTGTYHGYLCGTFTCGFWPNTTCSVCSNKEFAFIHQ